MALIKGYVSTLRREDARWDRSMIEESLSVIEDEADRLSLLIENMLDASRLQAGGFPLKRSDISLPDMIHRLAKRFQTQSSSHKSWLIFLKIIRLYWQMNRIEQVISNLISNAIKYSPEGEIRISGQVRPGLS